MDTSAHNDARHWEQEIGRLHARIDDFEARFEADYHILRNIVDTQIEELRAMVRKVEGDIAAISTDAYVQQVADQVAELKLKGDQAYALLQERLVAGGSRDDPAPDVGPPVS